MKKETNTTTKGKKFKIVENLDDHAGYHGQPVIIAASFENDYHDVMDGNGNTWHCGIEELKEIEPLTTTKGELLQDNDYQLNEQEMRGIYILAYGKEYDSEERKQTPLPLGLAFKCAIGQLLTAGRFNIKTVRDERQKLLDSNRELLETLQLAQNYVPENGRHFHNQINKAIDNAKNLQP